MPHAQDRPSPAEKLTGRGTGKHTSPREVTAQKQRVQRKKKNHTPRRKGQLFRFYTVQKFLLMNITIPTFPPAKLCCMFYPGNSVCFNTTRSTTISTDATTARPAKGAKSSSRRLGNRGFPTQALPDSPSSSRASQQQLTGAEPR